MKKFALWFLGIVVVLSGISVMLLWYISDREDLLKPSIEQYLSQASGMQVTIGTVEHIRFMPDIHFDFGDISFQTEDGTEKLSIGRVAYKQPSWAAMLPMKRMDILRLEGFESAPGMIGPQGLSIPLAALQEDGWQGDEGAMVIEGAYGPETFTLRLLMDMKTLGDGTVVYRKPKEHTFSLVSSFATATGTYAANRVTFAPLTVEDHEINGDLAWTAPPKMTLDFDLQSGRSDLRGDVAVEGSRIKADIVSETLALDDMALVESLLTVYGRLTGVEEGQETPEAGPLFTADQDMDITVRIKNLMSGDARIGQMTIPASLQNRVLEIKPRGDILQGDLQSDILLKETDALRLDLSGQLKDMPLAALDAFSGDALAVDGDLQARWTLFADAASVDGLTSALAGDIAIVAGEGKITSGMLGMWGAGLLSNLVPDGGESAALNLNCMIGTWKVEEGVAKAAPLFIDTDRITISGEGGIDIARSRVDLTLKPKSKNPSLFTMDTAVDVKGDLSAPSISPNKLSLGKMVGGLVLGTINPAWMVFSLSDLGLTDNHPCSDFIGEDAAEAGE